MPRRENTSRFLVTLFDPNDENVKNLLEWSPITLHHPSTGEISDYILLTTTTATTTSTTTDKQQQQQYHIYEVQSLETKYGSYFLGSHVVSDGNMYIATRVDPLFFVLYYLTSPSSSSSSSSNKWQPLDQLEIPEIIRTVISNDKQYHHLCQVNNQLGDDMLLYKLSHDNVLKWLTRKQEKAYHVLHDQAILARRKAEEEAVNGSSNSAMSKGFYLLDDHHHHHHHNNNNNNNVPAATTTTATTTTPLQDSTCTSLPFELSSSEQSTVHQHSMQIVCDYVTPEWRTKYMEHVGQPEAVLMVAAAVEENKTPKRTWEDADMMMNVVTVEKKKKPEAQSMGLKRLQKVSTKGMKSLSSFFGAKKN